MMTRLRMLFAVCLLLAVVGSVGFIPLSSSPAAAENAKQSDLLDINTATTEQLNALHGIVEAYSEKIIKDRPSARKDKLVQKTILPRAT